MQMDKIKISLAPDCVSYMQLKLLTQHLNKSTPLLNATACCMRAKINEMNIHLNLASCAWNKTCAEYSIFLYDGYKNHTTIGY